MLLFGSRLRSYRDLPIRYAESSTLHRNELAGTLHGLLRVRHVTQDDAHIFCTEEQIAGRDLRAASTTRRSSTSSSAWSARSELSTRPDNKLGTDEEWDLTEAALARRARAARHRLRRSTRARARSTGRRSTCTWTTRSAARGRWGRSSSTRRCRSASASPTWARTTSEHTPYVIHRALLGSLERFIGILIEHYARRLPVLARAGAGARAAGGRGAPRRGARRSPRGCARPDSAPRSAEPTETIGKRIRAAELEKIPVTVVYGDRESDESLAVRERGGEQSDALAGRLSPAQACYPLKPEKQGRTVPHLPGHERTAEVQPSRQTDEETGRCMQRLFMLRNETRRSKPNLVICL